MTDTECQCLSHLPSGTCMRSQDDGTCLLGPCNEGYRCDCFGYEKCSISKCGMYTSVSTSIPSESVPFPCQMTQGTGVCTNPVDILDTVSTARNAESDAAASNDEAAEHETDATKQMKEIHREKKAIHQILKEVEIVADDLPDAELDNIDRDSEVVEDAIEKAALLVLESVRASRKSAKALRESRRLKRVAGRADRMKREKKKQLEREEKKPETNKELCDRLRQDIQILEGETKKNARGCGVKAKRAREMKNECKERKEKTHQITEDAKDAGKRCMQKSQMSLGKALGRQSQ